MLYNLYARFAIGEEPRLIVRAKAERTVDALCDRLERVMTNRGTLFFMVPARGHAAEDLADLVEAEKQGLFAECEA